MEKNTYWIITPSELVTVNPDMVSAKTTIEWNSPAFNTIVYLDEEEASRRDCSTRTQGCCMTTPAPVLSFFDQNDGENGKIYGCPSDFHKELLKARDAYARGVPPSSGAGPMVTTATVVGETVVRATDDLATAIAAAIPAAASAAEDLDEIAPFEDAGGSKKGSTSTNTAAAFTSARL